MRLALLTLWVAGCAQTGVPRIQADARLLAPSLRSELARQFVAAASSLPRIATRVLEHQGKRVTVDEEYFYLTKYGSPLAYARPLDLLAQAGFTDARGKRILDFGYGNVGHLLLLKSLGAQPVGVDVDPLLPKVYGEVKEVRLVDGRFPADPRVKAEVGGPFDLVISKNVLKRGYIHPAEKIPERQQIQLGVDDQTFVRTIAELLTPGGRFLIYNICPAPAPPGKPYIPWADGHSPFPPALFEAAGLRVIAFDVDDTQEARAIAHTLGWDRGPDAMDLVHGLFAWYTLVEKAGN